MTTREVLQMAVDSYRLSGDELKAKYGATWEDSPEYLGMNFRLPDGRKLWPFRPSGALAGEEVVTMDGLAAKYLDHTFKGDEFKVAKFFIDGRYYAEFFDGQGRHGSNSALDLFMLTPPQEVPKEGDASKKPPSVKQMCRDLLERAAKDGLIVDDNDGQILSSGELSGMANMLAGFLRHQEAKSYQEGYADGRAAK